MIELLTLWVVISALFVFGRYIAGDVGISKKGRIKTNLNAVALTLNIYDYLKTVDYHKLLTPKTPIQKEIEEKRKEIEQLQEHIKDMAELNSLEQKEKELFRKIADEDLKSRGIDTKTTTELHFKWCEVCGNAYTGGSCDCLDKAEYLVDPLADRPYKLIYNGHEVPLRFRTHEEAHNYAKAISTSNWYIAEVERMDV